MDIREYVIGLAHPDEPGLQHEKFLADSAGGKKLYLIGDAADYGSTAQEIGQKLNGFYLPSLLDGKYSWDPNEHEWFKFSEPEIKTIEDCIAEFSA